MSEKGILTKEQEKKIAKYFDGLIDFTKYGKTIGVFIEFIDGKIFLLGITYLDDALGDKIPAEFKEESQLFMKAILEKNENDIVYYGTNLMNKLIDIPKITEETEAIFMSSILQGIIAIIKSQYDNK